MATRYMIAFMGVNYRTDITIPIYKLSDKSIESYYFLIAAKELYAVKKVFVISTTVDASREFDKMKNFHNSSANYSFQGDYSQRTNENIILCDAANESMYKIITDIVEQNPADEWIFDITGGFRSIPFETASILSYLTIVTPKVTIIDTIYAKGATGQYEYTSLNEYTANTHWAQATNVFIRYGQADLLSKQLEIFKQEQSHLASLIAELDKNIAGVADALHTANTRLLGKYAADLQKNINDMKRQAMGSGPLFTLLDRVADEYAVFIPKDNSYEAEIVRQRLVIKWYLEKRNWALAIQLAAEHLILLKQIADKVIDIRDPYRTRNLAGKVWYGWIFTNNQHKFIDIEQIYNTHVDTINKIYIDTATLAYQQAHMQPFQIWEDKTITYEYWKQFQAGTLDSAQCDAVLTLLKAIGDVNELKLLNFEDIKKRINKVYKQRKDKLSVKKLDVDDYRDIMIALAGGANPADYEDLLYELRKHNQLVEDCKVIKGSTPIGANIRAARNGMAHIDGVTLTDDIQVMCEQVCQMSEVLYLNP